MTFNMYSVKDEMTGKFLSPMFCEQNDIADSLAIRQFRSQINSIQLWKDNANDYSLFKVGIFDDEQGAASCVLEKIIGGRSLIND